MHRFNSDELKELQEIFEEAKNKQDDLVTKMVKYDDDFVAELKGWKASAIRKEFKRYEKSQRKEEAAEKILKEIKK